MDRPPTSSPLIVGLGGTPRSGSVTELCLRRSLAQAEALGCRTRLLAGPDLPQTIYDASRGERSESAQALIQALREADGIILATPSYHGSMSGLIKNALDHAEDLRTDRRPYLSERAVGCIVCAEGPQAMGSTLIALRSVVHALRAWPTPFGAAVCTVPRPFDAQGQLMDEAVAQALSLVADEVVGFARRFSTVAPRAAG